MKVRRVAEAFQQWSAMVSLALSFGKGGNWPLRRPYINEKKRWKRGLPSSSRVARNTRRSLRTKENEPREWMVHGPPPQATARGRRLRVSPFDSFVSCFDLASSVSFGSFNKSSSRHCESRITAVVYQKFVKHNVGEFQTLSKPILTELSDWRFFPRKLNQANLAARPMIEKGALPEVWLAGPDFLRGHQNGLPKDLPFTLISEEASVKDHIMPRQTGREVQWACAALSEDLPWRPPTAEERWRGLTILTSPALHTSSHGGYDSPWGRISRAKFPYDNRTPSDDGEDDNPAWSASGSTSFHAHLKHVGRTFFSPTRGSIPGLCVVRRLLTRLQLIKALTQLMAPFQSPDWRLGAPVHRNCGGLLRSHLSHNWSRQKRRSEESSSDPADYRPLTPNGFLNSPPVRTCREGLQHIASSEPL